MTRICTLGTLLTCFAVGCDPRISDAADESVEPPLKYSIKVGDTMATLSEGETVQLDGTFTNPTVTVTPQPHRVFPYQGITFKYPRSFTFEADLEDQNAKNWILSGNDIKIMCFVLKVPLSTGDFANNTIDQFGRENAKVVDAKATITLGKEKLTGTSLRVTVATHTMAMDIYRIPSPGTETKLLVIQDSLDDSGNRSKEGKRALAELKSSFAIER